MAEVNGIKVPFIPINRNEVFEKAKPASQEGAFGQIFQEELDKIKFSNHALKRLETRNIQLSDTDISKIQTAVDKAELKGSKNSLVMMEDTAFIVNIPNRTVVTTMPIKDENDNIFTNIDSVVFT
ncbi:MAG: TIGR02530 family flagellar biosynthesis protein [Bacteroidota bacterium]|nr:TIGR02530 family flagellar biosynthesis protein [Bacteroidota bacterium]